MEVVSHLRASFNYCCCEGKQENAQGCFPCLRNVDPKCCSQVGHRGAFSVEGWIRMFKTRDDVRRQYQAGLFAHQPAFP